MKKRNFENNIYMKIFNWAYIFLILSMLFSLTNLPLILATFTMKLNAASLPIFIASLILLLPSLTAGLATVGAFIKDKSVAPVKTYFGNFKRLIKKSLIVSLLALIGTGILGVDLKFMVIHQNIGRALLPLFVVLLILGWALAINCCFFIAEQPELSLREIGRYALVHLVKKWYVAILNVVILFLIVALMVLKPQFGLTITPSLLTLLLYQNFVISINAIVKQD